MYTSENNTVSLENGRRIYVFVSVFCLVFSIVYESFSHNVYSPYMVFAVAFPLIGGAAVAEILLKLPAAFHPRRMTVRLYNSGIAALTLGSVVRGVLDIYGTENPLVTCYAVVGIAFAAAGIVCWMIAVFRRDK